MENGHVLCDPPKRKTCEGGVLGWLIESLKGLPILCGWFVLPVYPPGNAKLAVADVVGMEAFHWLSATGL